MRSPAFPQHPVAVACLAYPQAFGAFSASGVRSPAPGWQHVRGAVECVAHLWARPPVRSTSLAEGGASRYRVWFGASTPMAALGEAFQQYRTIDRGFEVLYLTGPRFTREVVVLDVASDSAGHWATRSAGTAALSSAEHGNLTVGAGDLCGVPRSRRHPLQQPLYRDGLRGAVRASRICDARTTIDVTPPWRIRHWPDDLLRPRTSSATALSDGPERNSARSSPSMSSRKPRH